MKDHNMYTVAQKTKYITYAAIFFGLMVFGHTLDATWEAEDARKEISLSSASK